MKGVLETSRLKAPLFVVAALVLLVACADVGLRATFGLMPSTLNRTEFLNPEYLADIGGRVSAVQADRSQPVASGQALGIVVGFSTAREGIVEAELESQSPELRWLNLGGSGASFFELSYYLRPLVVSGVSPRVLVLGVHPAWLAGRVRKVRPVDTSPGRMLKLLSQRKLGLFAEGAKQWTWLGYNRNRVNVNARRWLASLRAEVLLGLGLPLSALFEPAQDPWHVSRRYDGQADAATKAVQMREWTSFRWFEAARYRDDTVEDEALASVLNDAQRLAKRVVVVWLPEDSELRSKVPSAAEREFRDVLGSRKVPLPLIDLRDALPDELFYDHVHPGASGRRRLTEILAERLRELEGK